MPLTHPPTLPVPGPKDDKPATIHSRSPPSPSPVVDIRPIVPHQPSRESPSPPPKPVSRPTTPQPSTPASRSTPQPEAPAQTDVKNEAAAAVEEPDDEDEEPVQTDEPVHMETFQQILELDEEDDEDREFSRGMVWEYFSQAKQTFEDLDEALAKKDLSKLSQLGHFLKGSSAALGISRVETACEKIQHYGVLRDEEKNVDLTAKNALELIEKTLRRVKKDYAVADAWLRNFFDEEEI